MQLLLDLYNPNIIFNEKEHSYYVNDKRYTSVTTLKNKLKKKFDTQKESLKYAKKHGLTQEEVLKDWENKRVLGTTLGTKTHLFMEYLWQNKIVEIDVEGELSNKFSFNRIYGKNFYNDYKNILVPVKLEIILWDDELQLAGQVDALFYDKRTNTFIIVDYKTDKKFEKYSSYGNKFLEPINHLDECELNSYALQLSLYKYMLEKKGIKIEKLIAIWLNSDLNENYQAIELPYLENEINKIIEWQLTNISQT